MIEFTTAIDVLEKLTRAAERIANAQEALLLIASEARAERIKLSTKMQEAMKRPLEGK